MKTKFKTKFIVMVIAIVMALSVAAFFAGCGDSSDDLTLYRLEQMIAQMQAELAARDDAALMRELERMLLERDLIAAQRALATAQAQVIQLSGQLANAETVHTNAVNTYNALQAELVNAATTPDRLLQLPQEIAVAASLVNSTRTQRDILYAQLSAALVVEENANNDVDNIENDLGQAEYMSTAQLLFNTFNRRIIRTGDYLLIPNRSYDLHAAQVPTILPPGARGASRTIRVPVNPQSVAVMCSSFLDIMIALGVQDRVSTFTHLNQPAFIEYYFPRTGANALPNMHGDGTMGSVSEPHSPHFGVLHEVQPDLIIMSARARARIRNYFGRLTYIAPTIDLGSRTGGDYFILDVIENLVTLAAIFEVEEAGMQQVAEMFAQMTAINDLATYLDTNALILQFNGMTAMSVFGAASRYSFVHRELGIPQATNDVVGTVSIPHGAEIAPGVLLDINPDIIFVVDRYALNAHRQYADGSLMATPINILEHNLFQGMNAVVNNQIHHLDPINWYLVLCGFRSLMYQFDELYAALRSFEASRN